MSSQAMYKLTSPHPTPSTTTHTASQMFSVLRQTKTGPSSQNQEALFLANLANINSSTPRWINENGDMSHAVQSQVFTPNDHPFIEVTFLNKIARIFLKISRESSLPPQLAVEEQKNGGGTHENEPGSNTLLERFIKLALDHFGVKVDFMESTHLFNFEKAEVVWEDRDLDLGKGYFLFFVRSGFKLTPETMEQADSFSSNQSTALFSKPLFHRSGKEFRIMVRCGFKRISLVQSSTRYNQGEVQELYIIERRRNIDGFHCPVMQCAKHFKKSCDLAFHFNIESGSKPFVCERCNLEFRRPSALNHHQLHCREPTRPVDPVESRESSPDVEIAFKQLWKPSLFLKQLALKKPEFKALLDKPKAHVEPKHMRQTCQTTLMAVICSQILKNYATQREVVDLMAGPSEKLHSARLNMCLQILTTTQLLEWMQPLLK